MRKHVAPMNSDAAINELRGKLSLPAKWTTLRDSVLYLQTIYNGRHSGGTVISSVNAMRLYYAERENWVD